MPLPLLAPRVILAHEHRRARRLLARAQDGAWDAHDAALASFATAVSSFGLELVPLGEERPVGIVRGGFRRWSADITIMEVKARVSGVDVS